MGFESGLVGRGDKICAVNPFRAIQGFTGSGGLCHLVPGEVWEGLRPGISAELELCYRHNLSSRAGKAAEKMQQEKYSRKKRVGKIEQEKFSRKNPARKIQQEKCSRKTAAGKI